MSVRIAVLSDNRCLSEAWLRAINGEPAYIAIHFASGTGVRLAVRSANPDVVVIDQQMPGAMGLCADLTSGHVPRVVFVNVSEDDDGALDALASGARGVVYASAFPDEVVKALHVVGNNQIWAPRHVIVATWMRMRTETDRRNASEAALARRLSIREREVFRYAAAGLGNKELANRLAISEATVKVHLTHIFQKLGLRGRGELAAAFHGILR
jgi:DNA-binding NarL/FixJ family response regulator